jgi:predicted transglutaminase-like cysteine proteinase
MLVESKRRKRKKRHVRDDEIIPYEFDAETNSGKVKKHITKVLSIILILIFLFSYIPFEHFFPMYSYQTFLSKKFTFNELFYAVFARINYRSDFDDFWNTPLTAWNTKNGDCEEFASITSDWLSHHGIENYLTGLSIKGSFMGHAVVFIKYENGYYIIDPTRALEKSGVKKLDKASNLKEAVLLYSDLPAYIFKVPAFDGEKKIIKTVE